MKFKLFANFDKLVGLIPRPPAWLSEDETNKLYHTDCVCI